MSGTDRQTKSPRPQGGGVTSVPVLFTLRNVQPSIVVSGTKTITAAKADLNTAPTQTPPSKTLPGSGAPTVSSDAPIPRSIAPQPKNNRSYNIVVGLLVIAVCLLVIKNTQRNGANSKTAIAAKSDALTPVDLSTNVITNSPLVAPISVKPTETTAQLPGPPALDFPVLPSLPPMSSNPPQQKTIGNVASNESASTLTNDSRSLQELNAYQANSADVPTQSPSAVPLLLSSSKPEVSMPNIPSLPSSGTAKNTEVPSLAFPDARTAMNPEMRTSAMPAISPTNPSIAQPLDLNSSSPSSNSPNRPNELQAQPTLGVNRSSASPNVTSPNVTSPMETTQFVDSRSPIATTREMQELIIRHEQNRLNNSANNFDGASVATQTNGQGIPASPASSIGTLPSSFSNTASNNSAFNNAVPNNSAASSNVPDNGMLSGQPYPPLAKENQPLPIRPYEQGGMMKPTVQAGGPMGSVVSPAGQTIKQPAVGSGNRYIPLSTQSSTAPTPYKPLATGYPPGNGN